MLSAEEPAVEGEAATGRLNFTRLQGLMSPIATAQAFQSHFQQSRVSRRDKRLRRQTELYEDISESKESPLIATQSKTAPSMIVYEQGP